MAAREQMNIPLDALTIGYSGRLHNAMKGTDDFVRTLAATPAGTWGVIAGSGPDESALRKLAYDRGVSDRLRFAGTLNPTLPIYHASDALVITSHYEPFGLVALEATACALPVFAFAACGGLVELLREVGATLIEPRDPGLMATSIINFFNLEVRNNRLPVEAATLTKYSWSSAARALAEDYRLTAGCA